MIANLRAVPVLLAFGLGVSGCVTWSTGRLAATDATATRELVPATWSVATPSSAASGSPHVRWWERFNDGVLTALVQRALAANTDIRSAQAALRESRALRDVQAATLFPSAEVSTSVQRSRSRTEGTTDLYEAGFDADWEIDVFGANRSGLRATEADARASAASLADTQVSIAAEVARTYIQVRGDQGRLDIARQNLSSQLETLQIANWRLQAGLTTSLDVEQARTTSEQTRAQIPALEITIAQAENSLAVLTGQSPENVKKQLVATAPVPGPSDDLAISMPAETLRQRADVRSMEYQVSAAKARVSAAEAARYPSFALGGSLGLQALTVSALTGGGSTVSALVGSVSMPLFDGGARRAQVRVQDAVLEQAWVNYEAQVLAAVQEVEDALIALKGDRERLVSLRNAAEAANNAFILARQRYTSGLIDFQVVLETQRTLLDTQDSVASTNADVSTDYVRLYKALGGGWQPDETPREPWTP